jgi:hypothetical protein
MKIFSQMAFGQWGATPALYGQRNSLTFALSSRKKVKIEFGRGVPVRFMKIFS